jgi:hypothetical protein
MGPDATISWDNVTNQPTAEDIGARPNTWTPTAADVGALATNWVGTTNINAQGIYTGTINANQINVGILTGFTIKTASSGERLELTGNNFYGYGSYYRSMELGYRGLVFNDINNGVFGGQVEADRYGISITGSEMIYLCLGSKDIHSTVMDINSTKLRIFTDSIEFPSTGSYVHAIYDGSGVNNASVANEPAFYPSSYSYGSLGKEDARWYKGFAGSWLNSSSIEEKENLLEVSNAYERIKRMKTYKYNHKGREDTQLGIVIEEIQDIAPELVYIYTGKDNKQYKYIDLYSYITFILTALKELSEKVEGKRGGV